MVHVKEKSPEVYRDLYLEELELFLTKSCIFGLVKIITQGELDQSIQGGMLENIKKRNCFLQKWQMRLPCCSDQENCLICKRFDLKIRKNNP